MSLGSNITAEVIKKNIEKLELIDFPNCTDEWQRGYEAAIKDALRIVDNYVY